MTIRTRCLLAALAASYGAAAAATPLAMSYSIADAGPGSYLYSFTLTLDNHDGTWTPGDNYNAIVFGDHPVGPTPLTDYQPSSALVGPFFANYVTFGAHVGPTLIAFDPDLYRAGWIPVAVGDALSWSGTSSAYLGQGQLLFSNLFGKDVYHPADFEVATLQAIPEPQTYALMLAGLGLVGWCARRRQTA
jgi:hypothetical protein